MAELAIAPPPEMFNPADAGEDRRTYIVVVPHMRRDYGRGPSPCSYYPPRGTVPYKYDEAVEVLTIFTARWIMAGQKPPDNLAPYAVEMPSIGIPYLFTLWEARPWSTVDEKEAAKDRCDAGLLAYPLPDELIVTTTKKRARR